MPFLRLNGYTVPVAKGGQLAPMEIGDRTRAYDGTLLTDRRAIKRVWSFVTPPVTELVGRQIQGIVMGEGDYWPFPSTGLFTSKGMAPVAGSLTTLRNSTSQNGHAIYDENGIIFEGNTGNALDVLGHAVAIDGATTNLVTAAQSEGTGGYTANAGAVLGLGDTTVSISSGSSLKITGAAIADSGFQFDTVAVIGQTYTMSVYMFSTTAQTIRLAFRNTAGGVIAIKDTLLPANAWRRVALTAVCAVTAAVRMEVNNASVAVAKTWWCDAIQIENLGFVTSWLPGLTSRAAGSLRYPAQTITSDDFTIGVVTKGPQLAVAAAIKTLLTLGVGTDSGATDYHLIGATNNTNHIVWTSFSAPTASSHTTPLNGLWNNAWRHLTFVCRVNPEAGEFKKSIYLDGVLAVAESPALMPVIANVTTRFSFDYFANLAPFPWNGSIDNVTYLPFAANAALAAAIAANAQSKIYPSLLADGDLMPENGANVVGRVTKVTYVGTQQSAAWRPNSMAVEFDLEEV